MVKVRQLKQRLLLWLIKRRQLIESMGWEKNSSFLHEGQMCYMHFPHCNIKETLLPTLALSVGTGCESRGVELSNRDVIPRDTGL